jgi:nitroimidazol reductase NimA-like FMN-containing flavoprotein (pyridoxamine 5'-phosphate oxidase superfamily)
MATDDTPTPLRTLSQQEIAHLLNLAIPAHLATLDAAGFPRITPLWFFWEDGIFYMSSGEERRHVHDLARDPRAGLCIAVEEGQTQAGSRPYRQIIVRGYAHMQPDTDEIWAHKLILKYITGQAGVLRAQQGAGKLLAVIALRPGRFLTTGYFPAK